MQTVPFPERPVPQLEAPKLVSIGAQVHYVLPADNRCRNVGEHRPATVVQMWTPSSGLVILQVLTDCTNDYPLDQMASRGLMWRTAVRYDASGTPGTWHWPEEQH